MLSTVINWIILLANNKLHNPSTGGTVCLHVTPSCVCSRLVTACVFALAYSPHVLSIQFDIKLHALKQLFLPHHANITKAKNERLEIYFGHLRISTLATLQASQGRGRLPSLPVDVATA